MSQEINLLNPALLPRRDVLGFETVAIATATALVLIGGLYAWSGSRADSAQRQLAAATTQLKSAQQDLQVAQAQLAAKKNDPALEQEAQRLALVVRQSRELLRLAEGSSAAGNGDMTAVMRGFSRQVTEGVWLTGFSVGPAGFEIRGRLLDPSLLPAYIRKLNGEPAFQGRRFAALDMRVGTPETPAAAGAAAPMPAGSPAPVPAPAVLRFTEFALQASQAAASAPGGRP
ncbi:MAG: hypothetical protein E6R10_10315 [Rhodocyclaceae bacterium]|nr:MAG: hypothetical protein E6R10_10315 [Rhodocyclaceae bacterium]